ncbi:hypothetical protein BCR33DRAFT_834585 [Rhizoclosmatium globosum]|uniref:C2H2-type domain-containing protein n=1 Tax=Rhizoclosmatium globosum TaxID=329046 RepID=A0A1Y2BRV2_9FUNG|nr:hypothetical protein BCR33DRAFT_834585 [Rhizoclosmatium globosum]|eukprot:ORY37482.1 hypothetical protein BCR33DRAFT_834585 [Rhizoclosmatium globosum]
MSSPDSGAVHCSHEGCTEVFESKKARKEHTFQYHSSPSITYRDQPTSTVGALKRHAKKCPGFPVPDPPAAPQVDLPNKCAAPGCFRSFHTRNALAVHLYEYHSNPKVFYLGQSQSTVIERDADRYLHCRCGGYSVLTTAAILRHARTCMGIPGSGGSNSDESRIGSRNDYDRTDSLRRRSQAQASKRRKADDENGIGSSSRSGGVEYRLPEVLSVQGRGESPSSGSYNSISSYSHYAGGSSFFYDQVSSSTSVPHFNGSVSSITPPNPPHPYLSQVPPVFFSQRHHDHPHLSLPIPQPQIIGSAHVHSVHTQEQAHQVQNPIQPYGELTATNEIRSPASSSISYASNPPFGFVPGVSSIAGAMQPSSSQFEQQTTQAPDLQTQPIMLSDTTMFNYLNLTFES